MSSVIPSLSPEEIAEIEHEVALVPRKDGAAIDAMLIVQRHRGWVSDESIRAIAALLEMSAEELDGIATFYNLIFRQPVGEKVILLCDSVSCWLRGCDGVKAAISDRLGVDYGETTADGRFTLLPVPCLGACDRAPVMMVGDDLHTHLDEADLTAVLDGREPS
jgi:NADH-quinone oxidoreductase subunit E